MNAADLRGTTIAFAASGGLDSCTITHWLTEHGVKVIAFTADLGQSDEPDLQRIETRMRAAGAVDFVWADLRVPMADIGLWGIKAQACYESRYWNTTGLARQVTVEGLLPEVKARGLRVFAHGCTGRGNDQVRFELISNMLHPDITVYAPWRDTEFLDRFRGRLQMIEYCEQHGIPIRHSRAKPYSTDANLLGVTHEGGLLESLETPAARVEPEMGKWPKDAPDRPERLKVRFECGNPVEINDRPVNPVQAFSLANAIAGRHGVGIGTHMVENRFVGIKSRGVYEAPGMELLGTAYAWLLQMVIDRRARELFDLLSAQFSRQIYQGYWNDTASRTLRRAIDEIAGLISGTVEVDIYKGGSAFVSARDVRHSLYTNDGSMEFEGSFDHHDSQGFLSVLGVHARGLARAGQVVVREPAGSIPQAMI